MLLPSGAFLLNSWSAVLIFRPIVSACSIEKTLLAQNMAVLGMITTKTSQKVRHINKLILDLWAITDDKVPIAAVQDTNKNTSRRKPNVSINMADVKATLREKRSIRTRGGSPHE